LWIRSASRAIEPLRTKTKICAAAVAPRIRRLRRTASSPARERLIEASTSPWLWP